MTYTDEWPTPGWLVQQLSDEFGPFDLDPAATPANTKAPMFYTRANNGLTLPWHGRIFLNPPYGRQLTQWLKKARQEVAIGNAEIIVCLIPASVGSKWWREHVTDASLIRVWPGRLKFGDGMSAPKFDSAIVVYGTLPGKHGGTDPAWCKICNRIYWPARSDAKTCSDRCRKQLSRKETG